jgi:hypothetical protein
MRAFLALALLWPTLALAAPSMRAGDWTFRYSPGMPAHPVQTKHGWAFHFPRAPGQVDMITTPVAGVHGTSIALSGRIVHEAVYNYRQEASNVCVTPSATARLYIEVAVTNNDYDRWWSNPVHVDLRAGAFSVTVPLNAVNWSSVYGHRSAGRLASAMLRARRVGLVYGGGCFFGHGVNIRSGRSTFWVTRYRIK